MALPQPVRTSTGAGALLCDAYAYAYCMPRPQCESANAACEASSVGPALCMERLPVAATDAFQELHSARTPSYFEVLSGARMKSPSVARKLAVMRCSRYGEPRERRAAP